MASAHDVAAYILQRRSMTAMKLQKLLYYSQAWHLVWADEALFPERIEAWANGPVVREIYADHRREFRLAAWPRGDASSLTSTERETVDAILDSYGRRDAHWLSELTHMEDPWRDARRGLRPGARSTREIPLAAMQRYYEAVNAEGHDL